MTHHNQEKRKHPRIRKSLPLKLSAGDFDIVTETENLSASGAYCKVDKYLGPMTKLKVLMLLPVPSKKTKTNKKVECEGVIVRSEPSSNSNSHYNIAVFFSSISERDKKIISDYVSNHLTNIERN